MDLITNENILINKYYTQLLQWGILEQKFNFRVFFFFMVKLLK